MRFIEDDYTGITDKTIQIEHKGQILSWDIVTYRSLRVSANLITDINNYWSRLPMEVQDAIFGIYTEIYDAFETIENTRRLNVVLVDLVAKLYEYHKYEDIFDYYQKYAKIKLPLDLKDGYGESDTPELTYLRGEYHELVAFAIALKIMIPIWGKYISLVGAENTVMKEYRASALLINSGIVKSKAYDRLKLYITTYWEGWTQEHSAAAVVAGLDGSQVPNWLLGNVLIRRISSAELIQQSNEQVATTIISTIFNYIDNLTKTMDKQFGGRINEKSLESSVGDDDNTSFAENYKIKQEVSEGIIVMHEVHLTRRTEDIIKRLNPEYDTSNFKQFIELVEKVYPDGFTPTPLSKALCQWVLDPVVTARIIDYVNYKAILAAHAATYVLLRSWGFNNLALFLFASPLENYYITNNVVRQQVTDPQLEQLEAIYPYTQQVSTKRKPSRRDSNVAVVAIRHVISDLYSNYFQVAPWEDISQYNLQFDDKAVGLPSEMELMLADLIIFLKTKVHPGLTSIVNLKQ